MSEARKIWVTGIEIIFEQWELLLEEAPEDKLTEIWNDIYSVQEEVIDFDYWLEGRD